MNRVLVSLLLLLSCQSNEKSGGFVLINENGKEELVKPDEYHVSMIKVISNPTIYDDKIIGVSGYLDLEFEMQALYLGKSDFDHNIYENSLCVEFVDYPDLDSIKNLSGQYVRIVGRFDADLTNMSLAQFGGFRNVLEISRIEN